MNESTVLPEMMRVSVLRGVGRVEIEHRPVPAVGPGHVLLGTDHPFELRDPTPVESVRVLGLVPEEERAVLWDTAARLLRLP